MSIEYADTNPDVAGAGPPPAVTYREVFIDAIEPGPWNPRRIDPRDPDLDGLARSIAAQGVIEPIVVRHHPAAADRFQIVAGERRWMAAQRADLQTVPCSIRDLTDEAAMEVCVIENLQRKDLPPIEESRGVQMLLAREGASPESVAVEIGRTAAWVAQRAAIAGGLSPRWREVLDQPDAPQAGFGAGHLVQLSRAPHDIQDEILEDHNLWRAKEWVGGRYVDLVKVPTVAVLRSIIAGGQRDLSAAPWKRDDADLVPGAGACKTCPKRTGANPLLFDDQGEDDAAGKKKKRQSADRCTDLKCWATKMVAWGRRSAAELQEGHGKVVLLADNPDEVLDEFSEPVEEAYYQHTSAPEKPFKGAVPGVFVEGRHAGRVVWLQKRTAEPRSDFGGRGAEKRTGPRPLAERKKLLERRRQKAAIESLFKEIVEAGPVPELEVVARLVAAVGTKHTRDSQPQDHAYYDVWWGGWETALDSAAVATCRKGAGGVIEWGRFDAYAGSSAIAEHALVTDLWRSALGVFEQRLKYQGSHSDTGLQWYEVKRLAGLVGIDPVPHWDAAVDALPEPKAWAKLEAAEKDAAAAARKAKRKKKPPAKKRPRGKAGADA